MVVMWHACGSFTGNMPNTAIADSIIETARLILKDSIDYIVIIYHFSFVKNFDMFQNSNPAWNVRVVYGDTDSLFIHMKGRSIKSAHELGLEIAREITKRHPYPIELKFEKVNDFFEWAASASIRSIVLEYYLRKRDIRE